MSPLVVNGRIQGFAWEPGRNAGYRAGRSLRWGGCCHQTAGRCAGDRSILTNLGGAYVPRDPGCGPGATQFSELDAVAFTQCEWNDELMACEVEWVPGQSFTGYQIQKCGLWVAACIELKVPDVRIDPPNRVPIGTLIRGFVDHRKLQHRACDEHGDGWYAHWSEIRAAAQQYLGGSAPAPTRRKAPMGLAVSIDNSGWYVALKTPGDWLLGVTIAGQRGWYLVQPEARRLVYLDDAAAQQLKQSLPWCDQGTKDTFDRVQAGVVAGAPLVYLGDPPVGVGCANQLGLTGMSKSVISQATYDALARA